MDKTFLSKSKYCQCVQCVNILWFSKYKPGCGEKENNDSILEKGRKVGKLAKGLFGDYEDVASDRDINLRVEKTQELLKDKPNIITEASFIHDNNFCS